MEGASRDWYFDAIDALGGNAVTVDRASGTVNYAARVQTDESHAKPVDPEELVHGLVIALLASDQYRYPLEAIWHEKHVHVGSKGSSPKKVDVVVYDPDGLPFAMIELKSSKDYTAYRDHAIEHQLFGLAPFVGSPALLVFATIHSGSGAPKITAECIDYATHKSFQSWRDAGEPSDDIFPEEYRDLDYQPFVNGGAKDLALDNTPEDFRAVAAAFHKEFFAEHPDNTLFRNLVKCLLAKIHDERKCTKGDPYLFQIQHVGGRPEAARVVFDRVNGLYKQAYARFIDPGGAEVDEIDANEFSPERVKTVVQSLQGMSITKGAAQHGDVIGAFFEQILRAGFKQDRGMYFTHDNLVRFMLAAVDLEGLTRASWKNADHPEHRLPYVIDPACGSGTFLLHAMRVITRTVTSAWEELVTDLEAEQFYKARLSEEQPNYWAENFVYGFDPKFIMAVTAKVNMVLHGDGSAHILKQDAFAPFSRFPDDQVRLRPLRDAARTTPRAAYTPDLCETFDLVVSNPPFGITLATETKKSIGDAFSLSPSTPSEGLFLERCFQLLKPRGRLAIVLPESVLNSKELVETRLLLYRCFDIRCVVSLPRNIFKDTPTLTSLVFAQKKSVEDLAAWDKAWEEQAEQIDARIAVARKKLYKNWTKNRTGTEVAAAFLDALGDLAPAGAWVNVGSQPARHLPLHREWESEIGDAARQYYSEVIKSAPFEALKRTYAFAGMVDLFDYGFPVFLADEIGYKLSARKEKVRPNQLCLFRGTQTGDVYQNVRLAGEECEVALGVDGSPTVLDYIRGTVEWE